MTAWTAPSPCSADTLLDAINLAYQTNPGLRAQQEELRATNETYVQARAGFGPQISVSSELSYQAARVQEPASFFTPKSTNDFYAANASADLSLAQPLFTSGAVTAQVRGAMANVLSERETLRQAEAQLILSVITAYVDVRRDRQILEAVNDEIAILTGEVAETKAKGALGVLSKTDVAQSAARLLAAQAQRDAAAGRLAASEAGYVNAVGESPGELAPEPDLPGVPAEVEGAFEAAEHNNPQLLAAIEAERAAREQVSQAKAAVGPTVSLKVDASVQPTEPFIPRQYDQSVTVGVVVNQPIYTSGLNASKIRQAADEDGRAALNVEETRRSVVQVVSQAWSQMTTAQSAAFVEAQQIAAEQTAVDGNRIEERAGLRSTIDLLNAESELLNTRIGLIQSRHDAYVATANLLGVIGLLELRYLSPSAALYDPVRSLGRVRSIRAPPWEDAIGAIDGAVSTGRTEPSPEAVRSPTPDNPAPAGAAPQAGGP